MENIKYDNLNKTPIRTLNSLNINDITLEDVIEVEKKEFNNINLINFEDDNIILTNLLELKKENNDELKDILNLQKFEYGIDEKLLNEAKEKFNQGYLIEIKENMVIKDDLYIEYNMDEKNNILTDNITIIANENSSATVIIKYNSNSEINGYHNGILKVIAEKKSDIKVVLINFLNNNITHLYSIDELVKEEANVDFTIIDFGGKHSISNFYSNLLNIKSKASLNTIYLGVDKQIIDINYMMRLNGEESNAKINVQGALKDYARKNFKGTIDFKKGAIKSVGSEEEYSILLSKTAKSKALPIMLCEEDYVVGNHSTACGKIDEDKLFYLMTRGLSYNESKKIIIKAKFSPIINNILDNNIKEQVLEEIDRRIDND